MEKKDEIVKIDIDKNKNEVVITLSNGERKVFSVLNLDLASLLNHYKNDLKRKLENIENSDEKFKFWEQLLRISVGLFGVTFLYVCIMVFLAQNIPLITLLPILPLIYSYFQYIAISNSQKAEMKQRKKILESLEKINEIEILRINLEKEIENRKIRQRKNLKSRRGKLNFNIDLIIKDTNQEKGYRIGRTKIVEQEKPLRAKPSRNVNLVASTIALSEQLERMRSQNNIRLDELDRTIDEFNGRGRR